jgi:hypothetical protein
MGKLYFAYNGPTSNTAKPTAVTTGTGLKTMMQLATPATRSIRVVEWGISFDGTAVNTPGVVELIETDVAATVTAYNAADIDTYNHSDEASLLTLGTSASGYTGSAEGSITASRRFDLQHLSPTLTYIKQFPLGREPEIAVSKFLRVRVQFGTAVNALCYIVWEE